MSDANENNERVEASQLAAASAAERVAAEIRNHIFTEKIAQGAPLREVSLAEELGVSRRTIREALFKLAAQGLVVHERNRGATVRVLGDDDVLDLYKVRRTLELQGARNAPFASAESRDRLDAAYQRLQDAAFGDDSVQMVRSDLAFHGAVVGLADSSRLNSFYELISPEMEMALSVIRDGEQSDGWSAEQIIGDHRTIHAALMARDAFEAQRVILAHIEFNERFLLTLLKGGSQ